MLFFLCVSGSLLGYYEPSPILYVCRPCVWWCPPCRGQLCVCVCLSVAGEYIRFLLLRACFAVRAPSRTCQAWCPSSRLSLSQAWPSTASRVARLWRCNLCELRCEAIARSGTVSFRDQAVIAIARTALRSPARQARAFSQGAPMSTQMFCTIAFQDLAGRLRVVRAGLRVASSHMVMFYRCSSLSFPKLSLIFCMHQSCNSFLTILEARLCPQRCRCSSCCYGRALPASSASLAWSPSRVTSLHTIAAADHSRPFRQGYP